MNRPLVHAALAAAILQLCACSGNQSSHVTPSVAMGTMTIVIKVPPKPSSSSTGRAPAYISPATQSVAIRPNNKTIYANVTPGSPNCSSASGTTTCTFQNIGSPVGQASIAIDTYDQPLGSDGLPKGNDLSAGWQTTAQIVEGQANVVNLTLGGIAAKATLTMDGSPQNGAASDLHVHLTVMDAAGFTIVPPGPYNAAGGVPEAVMVGALTTTKPQGNNDLIFSVNGVVQPFPTATLASPSDVLSIRYTGRGLDSATVAVTTMNNSTVKASATIVPIPSFGPNTAVSGVTSSGGAAIGQSSAGPGLPQQQTLFFAEPAKASIGTVDENGTYVEHALASGHTPQRITYGHIVMIAPPSTSGYSMFFTEAENFIGEIDSNGAITEYAVPTANAGVYDVCCTGGPLQYVYFTEKAAGKIATMQPGGFFLEHATGIAGSTPAGIAIGPLGYPWFADPGTNSVGYMDSSYVAHEYPLPQPNSAPTEVTPGPQGTLWFTEASAARVGTTDSSGLVREFPAAAPLTRIAKGPDNDIYALDTNGNIEQFDGVTGALQVIPVTAPAGGTPVALVPGIHEDILLLRTGAVNDFLY